ncbi:hypothetical protein GCM10023220_50020 [Streptomyces ziwulingensis]|uniref:Uncharacterized protein n=1 Tax=Streptomyces ziwulingensis TaxID=1045501 RepID=A0ABP9CLC8_9ACTN
MDWLKSLPVACDEFTATDSAKKKRTVQVIEESVPEVGDARQGLRLTVDGTAAGDPATLTLDLAAVRVGDSALTVTGGGLDGGARDSVRQGASDGTERLQDVLAGRTPAPTPETLD